MTGNNTVYDHIRRNNIKTILLILLFPMIFIALIFLFTLFVAPASQATEISVSVAIPTFIICGIWIAISWSHGDSMMLRAANAREIHPNSPQNRAIFQRVENVALAAGLPTPRVYIIETDAQNAFATGRTPNDASIALTRGLINSLDNLELDGVIAHEMAHIGNRDIRLDMLIITGIGITTFLGDILGRGLYYDTRTSNDKESGNLGAILVMVWLAFMVFNLLITPLLRMAISRNREYAADATGAHITRNPAALASALGKISRNSHIRNTATITSMASVFIASPAPRKILGKLTASHPPIDIRIERLKSMAK